MKQKTQILNQFESLLYTANPELIAYCKSGVPTWLLKLLKQYPTAAKLAKAKAIFGCPDTVCNRLIAPGS